MYICFAANTIYTNDIELSNFTYLPLVFNI